MTVPDAATLAEALRKLELRISYAARSSGQENWPCITQDEARALLAALEQAQAERAERDHWELKANRAWRDERDARKAAEAERDAALARIEQLEAALADVHMKKAEG